MLKRIITIATGAVITVCFYQCTCFAEAKDSGDIHIKVDQIGYPVNAPKVEVIGD